MPLRGQLRNFTGDSVTPVSVEFFGASLERNLLGLLLLEVLSLATGFLGVQWNMEAGGFHLISCFQYGFLSLLLPVFLVASPEPPYSFCPKNKPLYF